MEFTVNAVLCRGQITPKTIEGAGSPEFRYLFLGKKSLGFLEANLTTAACGSGGQLQGFRLFETAQPPLGRFRAYALAPTYFFTLLQAPG